MRTVLSTCLACLFLTSAASACNVATTSTFLAPAVTTLAVPTVAVQSCAIPGVTVPTVVAVPQIVNQRVVVRQVVRRPAAGVQRSRVLVRVR